MPRHFEHTQTSALCAEFTGPSKCKNSTSFLSQKPWTSLMCTGSAFEQASIITSKSAVPHQRYVECVIRRSVHMSELVKLPSMPHWMWYSTHDPHALRFFCSFVQKSLQGKHLNHEEKALCSEISLANSRHMAPLGHVLWPKEVVHSAVQIYSSVSLAQQPVDAWNTSEAWTYTAICAASHGVYAGWIWSCALNGTRLLNPKSCRTKDLCPALVLTPDLQKGEK